VTKIILINILPKEKERNTNMNETGKIEGETEVYSGEESENQEDYFVWDENYQLYYHARSGFYHDPNAGWYYNTRDGFYYKFEDGNYVLFDSYNKGYQSETEGLSESVMDGSRLQAECVQGYSQNSQENEGCFYCTSSELPDNPPPSEWLEDTLIELYLSGYRNTAYNAADNLLLHQETVDNEDSTLTTNGNNEQVDADQSYEHHAATDSAASDFYEEVSWEEESWLAQYGQVVQQEDKAGTGFNVIDMWDWSMVREIQNKGSRPVVRIVGRLVQPSSKLHPSMPSHGRRLRTAPICKVHLDLVQVRSGQVYKLRTPSAKFLATLPSYDASNPTKDWGFPVLSIEGTNETGESKTAPLVFTQQGTNSFHSKASDSEDQKSMDLVFAHCTSSVISQHKTRVYRDRAAERRALHGGFGVAPGQKRSMDDASPPPTEEAAAEALEMSLGTGSYARKILKNMGWKEGEGLGKSQQGLKEPLQGVGNKGTAGLGWKSR
ncbi:SUPPRESSOR OF ABI3-5, partial [Bienertia sinuspersici]